MSSGKRLKRGVTDRLHSSKSKVKKFAAARHGHSDGEESDGLEGDFGFDDAFDVDIAGGDGGDGHGGDGGGDDAPVKRNKKEVLMKNLKRGGGGGSSISNVERQASETRRDRSTTFEQKQGEKICRRPSWPQRRRGE
mmetsp:Transcript_49739/g.122136  ORF Transcript_49739/g.122136 Transcript_49739/m.122136 type:complete len:137 (-) Transcript_49739:111-521(-)